MNKWYRSVHLPHQPLEGGEYVTLSRKHIDLSCEAATEGMVLLKNDGALPLTKGTPIALLGKGTYDHVKGGGGSGEVHTSYIRNIAEGIELLAPGCTYAPLNDYYREYVNGERAKGIEFGMLAEPELPAELLAGAARHAEVAVVSISRFSGEGWDRPCGFPCGEDDPWTQQSDVSQRIDKGVFMKGDFSLTDAEQAMVDAAFAHFKTVIVLLNVGGVVDTAWLADKHVSAALLTWQAGMEGGLAAAKLLFGDVNPSGKLVDTFPVHISDFPSTEGFHESRYYVNYTEDIYVGYRYFETIPGMKERVVYPFGYGFSYTTFQVDCEAQGGKQAQVFRVKVTNTGSVPGKEVVQVYASAPQGKLGKPARHLAAYQKTKLLAPGECQDIELTVDLRDLASYDDVGAVRKSAWVLEQGEYAFYLGTDVRNAALVHTVTLEDDVVVQQLTSHLAPVALPRRLRADGTYEELPCDRAAGILVEQDFNGPKPSADPNAPAFQEEPVEGRILLRDVAEGQATLDDFLAQLTDEELISLSAGQPNTGWADTCGIGNVPQYGVPNVMTADGPAGVRLNPPAPVRMTAFPCGTLLACTWDPAIAERVGTAGGAELKECDLQMWLTPAVNIHRNPLCGRNFEYYSEDPLVAGLTGSAMVRGIQSNHVSCSVKHFACNNKEHFRSESDSHVSERALREIYLRQFEIIVKTADPMCFMTSYNAVNGQRTAESYELLTDILRGEWGYQGMVTTDWWGHTRPDKEILAGNDVKMPCGVPAFLRNALADGSLTREDLLKCVRRTMQMILSLD